VGVAGFLFPGSHVDVLTTFNAPTGGSTATQTVLQNVEVLTTGTTTEPDPSGKPQTVSVVTLLLTPEDSQKLLLISTQGNIQFVLRNGVDKQKVDVLPTRIEQVVSASVPPPPPAPVLRPAVLRAARKAEPAPVPPPVEAKPPAEPHLIEVIQGSQRTTQKF
jgi:pilus assembly protein CpaB